LYGGTKRTTQRFEAFGADIIVGTPGRVADLLFPRYEGQTKVTNLFQILCKNLLSVKLNHKQHFEHCDFIVFDEADRMLDDGFEGINKMIIEKIEEKRGPKPISKVLTSATFPVEIQDFASNLLRPNYMYAQCGILNAPR
jgi:superfamily II DNA/RNA helicase